ncbi:MAG: TetR/AcrR family transcriptional regulator C-terminal domain-containing protein [Lachnospiraceae bacterium]|nr:TetR/AcrR family transcriptional regulator C-terminal domain-containing protein [Lachnospiraceae bacterium]
MPNSDFTKKALKSALWELVEEESFEKVTISQICDKCGMNRNSFYYHFKDKYDLINWIFDTDYIELAKDQPVANWELLKSLCNYLYENQNFYRKIFKIEGQNSFSEHFQEFLYPLIYSRVKTLIGKDDIHPFCINFLADGILCALKRWLLDKDCLPPDQFVSILKTIIQGTAIAVYDEVNN